MDALELRGWASNNPLLPNRDLNDPLGTALLTTFNGQWDALQNHINSRIAELGDNETATEQVRKELYDARWGPTRLPIYNVILQFFFFHPEDESNLLSLTQYLISDAKLPVTGTTPQVPPPYTGPYPASPLLFRLLPSSSFPPAAV